MKLLLRGALCTVLAVGLFSCQDPTTVPGPSTPGGGRILAFNEQSQANNAYDWFGWFHNQAMGYGLTWQNDYLGVAPITASYMTGDFLVDFDLNDGYTTSHIYPISYSVDSIRVAIKAYTAGKSRAQIVDGLPFSSASKGVVTQLFSLIDQAYELPFLLKCDTLVTSVLNNSQIDSSEKVILQSVIAVAYHSFQFWDYYIQDDVLQSTRIPFVADAPNKKAETKNVVEADVVGGTVGAAVGGAGGAIGGGIFGTTVGAILTGGSGAAPGAAVGAALGFFRGAISGLIGGALAGSVYEGIVKPMLEERGESSEPTAKDRQGP